jgi:hypothetical protein
MGKFLCVMALLVGCEEKEPRYSKEDLLRLTPSEGDDRMETVLGQSVTDIIPCSNYGEGCLSVHRFKSRRLEYIAVEFSSIAQAQASARKIRAWTARNWLFDDVYKEPMLERWLCQYLECVAPVTQGASEKAAN